MHSDIWFSDLISVQKPEYLTTPKTHCGTNEMGIGKLQARDAHCASYYP